jgi:hypothetical protein
MSRTCRWVGLAITVAACAVSATPRDARGQDKAARKVEVPAAPKDAPKAAQGDEKYIDAVTIPTDRESRRQIEAAQAYIKRKDWRTACECLQSLLESTVPGNHHARRGRPAGHPPR